MDSEYEKNLQSEAWCLMKMSRSTSSGKFSIHRSATANYKPLRKEAVARGVEIDKCSIKF
jgi:secreted Zn-dependent insulinase-like peptidase